MALDLNKISENITKHLENITKEDIEKYFPKDKRPKGWLSIEEYLPMWLCDDLEQGYSIFRVKDKSGDEFESAVADHNVWYYEAKAQGITHWLNK